MRPERFRLNYRVWRHASRAQINRSACSKEPAPREDKPCLSECSGCRGLLKCQVLFKNNTLLPLARTHSLLCPCFWISPALFLPLSRLHQTRSQHWNWGWGMKPGLGSASGGKRQQFLLPSEVLIYLPPPPPSTHTSPTATEVETESVMKWNHFSLFFSLSFFVLSSWSCRHTPSVDSSHFISCLFPCDVAPDLLRPKIPQAPSKPSVH